MIPAADLNDWHVQASAEYDRACAWLLIARDSTSADPFSRGARELVVPLLERVCEVYESRLEQVEAVARAQQEQPQRRTRYDVLPNAVSVPGLTLAEDVARRQGGAA